MNFLLKAPGTNRLKLICDKPLYSFAFHFNLRRYTKDGAFILVGRCRLTL